MIILTFFDRDSRIRHAAQNDIPIIKTYWVQMGSSFFVPFRQRSSVGVFPPIPLPSE
jgi:hypothetical protein